MQIMFDYSSRINRGHNCIHCAGTVSIPQAVCTRCNGKAQDLFDAVTEIYAFQYRKRYVRVATIWAGKGDPLYGSYVSIPQAVCTCCNLWKRLMKSSLLLSRFNTASGMYALQRLDGEIIEKEGNMFQYRKRYVRVATELLRDRSVVRKSFNTASGMYVLQQCHYISFARKR